MIRFAFIAAIALSTAPAFAQDSKEESCGYQAQVVGAIQQARLDRVSERDVQAHILSQDTDWPEQYNNAIPLITPWVYEQKRRVLRNESLSDAWSELCLQQ
ncbi:hypothetical protein [uncultured Tateyamaria sp.]|uniref:hypothetical protein n=1 Tax=uncultured Tateyamaria sp. TaxID=455651 RepID=UPI002607D761|nr:hypothetical protein [uncultured Tateyamaria sp.]